MMSCMYMLLNVLYLLLHSSACSSPSVFLPSSSCSSYFYCDWLGNPQEGECEEGKLWNKDLEFCDLEENVSCGKDKFYAYFYFCEYQVSYLDLLWLLRRGSSYVKAGLQLVSIAHRVTSE